MTKRGKEDRDPVYLVTGEKLLRFLNTADNDVCLEWRALPEDEAQQTRFLLTHAPDICVGLVTAGA